MGTLWNATDREALIKRVEKLDASNTRQWGTMTVAQMLTHLIETSKITFNEKPVEVIPGKNPPGFIKWLIIFSPLPWPKGKLPTAKEYLADSYDEQRIEEYKQEFIASLQRFALSPETLQWGKHAFFVKLSAKEWGALTYKHTDHHLRQFGC